MNHTEFINWLLESPTPSIRYLTLTRLLERPDDDTDVKAARAAIMNERIVPQILAKQTATGQWADEHSYYTPKYISTHWSMMLLVEFAADGSDERLRRGAAYMLDATEKMLSEYLTQPAPGMGCLWGNIYRYVAYSGLGNDGRARRILAYLIRDLGHNCQCPINHHLACAWGTARTLWGVAAIPPENRSPELQAAINHALDFMLQDYQLIEGSYPTPGTPHKLWRTLNFPMFYQADILFVLRVVAELDALDHPGAQPALAWLAARRQQNGHWRGRNPFGERTWPVGLDKQDSNRWVSLFAADILKRSSAYHQQM